MELPPEELLTLLDARRSAQTVSLDAEMSDDAEAPRLETFLGRLDEGYEQVEQAQWLNWVYGQVTPTESCCCKSGLRNDWDSGRRRAPSA